MRRRRGGLQGEEGTIPALDEGENGEQDDTLQSEAAAAAAAAAAEEQFYELFVAIAGVEIRPL